MTSLTRINSEPFYSRRLLTEDQNAVYPAKEIEDTGAPQGDPIKFIERQKVLSDDRIETISRTVCETIIAAGSRNEQVKNIVLLAPSLKKGKEPKDDKNASMLACLEKDLKSLGAVTAREMQLACGDVHSKNRYFGQAIDRTSTVLGHTFLIDRLTNPITDLTILKKRQAAIAILQTNPHLQGFLAENLSMMQGCEGPLLSFWNKVQVPNCIGKLGFQNLPDPIKNYGNKSPFLRECCAQYETATSWLKLATQAAAGTALTIYGAMRAGMVAENPTVAQFAERYSGSTNVLAPSLFSMPDSVQSIAAGAIGASVLSTIPGTYRWLLADREVTKIYARKMQNIAHFINGAAKIYHALSQNPKLSNQLENFNGLQQFFEDTELKPLFLALQKIGPEASYLARWMWHPILISMQYLQDKSIRNKFEKALVSLAEIDTVLSCTRLLQSNPATPYSLAHYDSGDALIEAEGLFNPQVTGSPILNSVKLTPRCKEVITGPNGGGKSTLVRGVLNAAVMAQTLTVVSAQRLILTPFDDIRSALNTREDAAAGLSHFQAQVQRATLFVQDADTNKHKRFLIGMDEPFNGASADNAAAFSAGLLQRLGAQANSLCLIATHDPVSSHSLPGWTFTQMNYDSTTQQPLYLKIPGVFTDHDLAIKVAAHTGCDSQILASAMHKKTQ